MMRALVERFGADYSQWRALTRASLKMDMRRPRGAVRHSREKNSGALLGQFIFYGIVGLMLSAFTAMTRDHFLAAILIVTYAVFMVGVMVLVDYHSVVTSPDDYNVLGFQPVSSRTYFAARITNLLIFVLITSSLIALPSAVTLTLRSNFQAAVGAALMLATWTCAATTALAMVLFYGWLVQRVRPAALRRTLSYVQLAASFVVYGGYILMPQYLQRLGLGHAHVEKTLPILLFPVSWFASFVDIARGLVGPRELIPATAAIALLIVTARAASGRISLDFAERLSLMASTGTGPVSASSQRAPLWFREGEKRAIWLLVRGQFRSDQRFRMGVLAVLPMTLLYLFMAVSRGGLGDPFLGLKAMAGSSFLYIAVIMFPVTLVATMTTSDNYKAAWIFYATAADRAAIVWAMKDVVFIYFVLPYLGILGLLFVFWMHNVLHVVVHVLMLALISHLSLLMLMLLDPRLPFAQESRKGERSARLFMVTIVAAIFAGVAIPLTSRFIYISAARTATAVVVLLGLSVLFSWAGRARVNRLILNTEFAG